MASDDGHPNWSEGGASAATEALLVLQSRPGDEPAPDHVGEAFIASAVPVTRS